MEVIFSDTRFHSNEAGRSGGAISAYGNPFRIHFFTSQFLKNRAHRSKAIHLGNVQGFSVEGCLFENKTADDNGGALRLHQGGMSAAVMQSTFVQNRARAGCAGLEITSCTFRGNSVQELSRAGFMSSANSNIRVNRSLFIDNTAVVGYALHGAPLRRFQVEEQLPLPRQPCISV